MSKLRISCLLLCILASVQIATAQGYVAKVKKGNEALKTGDSKSALDYYHDAETDIPESPELSYNIAGALHQQKGFEEAVAEYQKALKSTDISLEAHAQYNLGNTFYRMGDYEKAITSYENALKDDPRDMDAKFNLELARKQLKEQTKPQQQQQKQQDQQNKQDQKQNQDQQKQQQQDKQSQQDKDQSQNPDQREQNNPKEQKMSKEDAERILNSLRDDEQKLQKKAKREVVAGDYTGKDW
ncbi:MAG: tetratricopeptide repeat protein [Candidatus Zixiibacteriota bacterium]